MEDILASGFRPATMARSLSLTSQRSSSSIKRKDFIEKVQGSSALVDSKIPASTNHIASNNYSNSNGNSSNGNSHLHYHGNASANNLKSSSQPHNNNNNNNNNNSSNLNGNGLTFNNHTSSASTFSNDNYYAGLTAGPLITTITTSLAYAETGKNDPTIRSSDSYSNYNNNSNPSNNHNSFSSDNNYSSSANRSRAAVMSTNAVADGTLADNEDAGEPHHHHRHHHHHHSSQDDSAPLSLSVSSLLPAGDSDKKSKESNKIPSLGSRLHRLVRQQRGAREPELWNSLLEPGTSTRSATISALASKRHSSQRTSTSSVPSRASSRGTMGGPGGTGNVSARVQQLINSPKDDAVITKRKSLPSARNALPERPVLVPPQRSKTPERTSALVTPSTRSRSLQGFNAKPVAPPKSKSSELLGKQNLSGLQNGSRVLSQSRSNSDLPSTTSESPVQGGLGNGFENNSAASAISASRTHYQPTAATTTSPAVAANNTSTTTRSLQRTTNYQQQSQPLLPSTSSNYGQQNNNNNDTTQIDFVRNAFSQNQSSHSSAGGVTSSRPTTTLTSHQSSPAILNSFDRSRQRARSEPRRRREASPHQPPRPIAGHSPRSVSSAIKSLRSQTMEAYKSEDETDGQTRESRRAATANNNTASKQVTSISQPDYRSNNLTQPTPKDLRAKKPARQTQNSSQPVGPRRSFNFRAKMEGLREWRKRLPELIWTCLAVWEGQEPFDNANEEEVSIVGDVIIPEIGTLVQAHYVRCASCRVAVKCAGLSDIVPVNGQDSQDSAPDWARISTQQLSLLCPDILKRIESMCKEVIEQRMIELLEPLPLTLKDSRPSPEESAELQALVQGCARAVTLLNLRKCAEENQRIVTLKLIKEPLFQQIDSHKRLLAAIDEFENHLTNKESAPDFTFDNTTVITSSRFRTHSSVKVVDVTKKLKKLIREWESMHRMEFREFGVRYLNVLPTDNEITLAEAEAKRTMLRDPLFYQPTDSTTPMFEPEGLPTCGKIRVVARVRPLMPGEGQTECVSVLRDGKGVQYVSGEGSHQQLRFTSCVGPSSSQTDVFRACGLGAIVQACVHQGLSATVMAYGQTGSGKTHTMSGPSEGVCVQEDGDLLETGHSVCNEVREVLEDIRNDHIKRQGIIPRAARAVMDEVRALGRSRDVQVQVSVSFLEVYNETVVDLLKPSTGTLVLRNIGSRFIADSLVEIECHSVRDLVTAYVHGHRNRTTGQHALNSESSRSHSLFRITITTSSKNKNSNTNVSYSELNFVDLAGSERLKLSKNTDSKGVGEALHINKSLHTLSRVVCTLATGDSSAHVPYRDSVLTKLLMHVFQGEGANVMVACVSPCREMLEESVNTLKFAGQAAVLEQGGASGVTPRRNTSKKSMQSRASSVGSIGSAAASSFAATSAAAASTTTMQDGDDLMKRFQEVQRELQRLKMMIGDS